jgi:hypothetical protein
MAMSRAVDLVLTSVGLVVCAAWPAMAQSGAADLPGYFQGKQVQVKIDMPGTQQGVDLRFDRSTPMDWKQYSSRLKQFGVAIPKEEHATVTSVVVKKDMIEFQLDGGGFGTFGDDTKTTVDATPVEKSNYEKQLERDIANTDDPDQKRDLQRQLDRERDKRERQDAANRRAAQVASQIKAQQVADNRLRGGSRFNLRWKGSIPVEYQTPEGVMHALEPYLNFDMAPASDVGGPPNNAMDGGSASAPPPPATNGDAGAATAQLKRGMSMNDVNALLGQGRQLSESVSSEGFKTQVFEYLPGDRRAEVTFVDGLVIRFTISSR